MTKEERRKKLEARFLELTVREKALREEGFRYIAGIDEVGRGPLAGPVYAACVVLPEDFDVLGIDDSKKVSEKKRKELAGLIRERAAALGIGIASAGEIDRYNILEATKIAMKRAVAAANSSLKEQGASIDYLLIDALTLEDLPLPQEGIIKGDAASISIAAASIVAKVARDSYMEEMDEQYPGYGFRQNKGYGTAAHYEGLRTLGFTEIHRRSFLKNFESRHSEEAMAKKNYYAVRKGRNPGIYRTWEECRREVTGFKGAEYKGFEALSDAEAYMTGTKAASPSPEAVPEARAYVDGSYDAATKRFSSGAVILIGENEICLSQAFSDPAASELRNVAGEIHGARLAVDYCLEHGIASLEICHDYTGVGKWGDDEWKANLEMTRDYKDYIARAREKMTITFRKVPAHSGDHYNDMADRLAKEALGIGN